MENNAVYAINYSRIENGALLPRQFSTFEKYLPPRTFKHKKRQHKWLRILWQILVLLLLFFCPYFVSALLQFAISYGYSRQDLFKYSEDACSENTIFAPTNFLPVLLSFGQAKSIDIAWNLVVGRGVQGLIGLIMYSVATQTLLRITEITPVSYGFFAALSLFPSNLRAVPSLIKGTVRNTGWRAKVATIWLLLSCILVLAIPTLLDAMSGYVQAQDKYIFTYPDRKLVKASEVEPPPDRETAYWNGTTFYAPKSYTSDSNNTQCVFNKEEMYRWGLSSDINMFIIALLMAWGVGTWGVWMDAQYNCEQRRKGRSMDLYSATCDLAGAIHEQLGPHVGAYSGRELEKALKHCPKIMYGSEARKDGISHLSLSSRHAGKLELSFEETYG